MNRISCEPGISPERSKTRPGLPVLTSLRFIAALVVLISHWDLATKSETMMVLRAAGYTSVLFFFVLSGFILSYVYWGQSGTEAPHVKPVAFWRARFARLMPSYALALLIGLPLFAYGALVSHITPMWKFASGLVLVPLFLQSWFPSTYLVWNAPAWSLSVEAFFYALFPFVADLLARVGQRTIIVVSLALLLVLAVLCDIWATTAPATWEYVRHHPLVHLPAFFFGMVLGRFYLFGFPIPARWSVQVFTAAMVAIVGILAYRLQLPSFATGNGVMALLFGVLIFGSASLDSRIPLLCSAPMVALGEASYALYILHMPLLFWWAEGKQLLRLAAPPAVDVGLYSISCIIASLVVWKFWELPLRRLLHRAGANVTMTS